MRFERTSCIATRVGLLLPASTFGRAPRINCSARWAATSTKRNLLSTLSSSLSSIRAISLGGPRAAPPESSLRVPVLEVFQNAEDPAPHAVLAMTLLQDDRSQHFAGAVRVV